MLSQLSHVYLLFVRFYLILSVNLVLFHCTELMCLISELLENEKIILRSEI